MILLTGATGFLGSRLLKKLAEQGYDVVCVKRSTSDCRRVAGFFDRARWLDSDRIRLESMFVENKIEVVIHCATNYGRDDIHYFDAYESNLGFPLQLMKYAERYGCRYFINTSTFFVREIEQQRWNGRKVYMDAYVRSKDMFCMIARNHIEKTGMVFINLQPEHIYGMDDHTEKFVDCLVKSLRENVPVIELSAGTQKRDWIYIDDVVSAYMTVLDRLPCFAPGSFHHFEVGTGKETSLKSFVLLAKEKLCSSSVLEFGKKQMYENELESSCAANEDLKKLGWKPQFDLEKGIEQMIEEK